MENPKSKTDLEIHLLAPEGASSEELSAYLEKACGGDRELRARVEALFAADEHNSEFMEGDPGGELLARGGAILGAESPGDEIGNYKLLQRIGEGGFGVVYMAEQLRPVKRRVALKIIKLGMDTKQVVARFEAERQALALMDHPNIAKVHDAGATPTGRPYFVMELVRGIPITQFCDENNLSTHERLELFIAVCQAVQHAHQKGVIHRDLKPSNVMVTLHDDKAVPKVIDFGVAKATQMELTEKTLFTLFEQFIGTPAYMSPEQAQMSGLDIDTRSDIYSLGVLLYELLTGTTPFDAKTLAKAGMDEVRRVIREKDPPRPSLRLSTMGGAARTDLAKHRNATPDKLTGLLRGDLDWIVMKALEKNRARRYETANGLAEDIRRHLADEPVSAGAPGPLYRLGKYVRRHRAGLGVAAVIALLLVAGTAVSARMAIDLRESNQELTQTSGELEKQLAETDIARARADKNAVSAKQNERQLAFRLADEDPTNGRMELNRILRDDLEDHVTAERVMSSLWHRGSIIPLSPPFYADAAAITEDGKHIVLGDENDQGTLQIVDSKTGDPVTPSLNTGSPILGIGFSSDARQRRIITLGLELPERLGLVEVWEWKDEDGAIMKQPLRVGSFRHNDFVHFVQLSPDGTKVLTGGQGPGSRHGLVWTTGSEETLTVEEAAVTGNRDNHNTLTGCWSPDGTRVATAGTPSGIWQIDEIRGGKVVGAPVTNRAWPQGSGIKSIRFSPDGHRVVTASHDHTAQVWDARTGEPVGKRLLHAEVVSFAEFSPQRGGPVLTASLDGTIRLWHGATGEPLLPPFEHPGGVEEAHFSPDGQLVVSDCEDNRLRVWHSITGTLLDERAGTGGPTFRTATKGPFADRGRSVLLRGGGDGGGHRVWPLLGAQALHQKFRHAPASAWEHPGKILAADFHPTKPELVSVSREVKVRLWNRRSGKLIQAPVIRTEARKQTVSFSPDGDRLLVATSDAALRVSDGTESGWTRPRRFAATGPGLKESMEELYALIVYAEFSPLSPGAEGGSPARSRWIVSANYVQNKAEVWDAQTGNLKATLGRGGRCTFASFSADGTRVVTAGIGGSVEVWEGDWENGQEAVNRLTAFQASGGDMAVVFFHPVERDLVLCASRGGRAASIWRIGPEVDGATLVHRFEHDGSLGYAEWSRDGSRVVTASHDGTARLWDVENGKPVGQPMVHEGAVVRAEFSPDGRRVVTASQDGTARVWDTETGFPLCDPLLQHSPINFARFSPDGTQVVTTGDDATVRLWDVPPAPPGPVPEWVPGWIEAINGMRLEANGSVTPIAWKDRERIRKQVESLEPDDYYVRVAQWFYQDPATRPITPFSEVTVEQYAANRIRENTETSLEEALEADPSNRPALVALAELLGDAPPEKVADLRRAAYCLENADPAGEEDSQLAGTIARKLRFAQAMERIEALKQQAAASAAAGDYATAEPMLGTATLAWILCTADYEPPNFWSTIDRQIPILRGILDTITGAQVLVAPGSPWRFPAKGDTPGDRWTNLDHDDSDWQGRPAPLGFSDDREDGKTTVITRDDTATTYYFRHGFEWPEGELPPDDPRRLALRIRCEDGAVVHLNGQELLRVNLSADNLNPDTQAATERSGAGEQAWSEHLLDPGLLRQGANLLAVEVHQKHGEKGPSSSLMPNLALYFRVPAHDYLLSLLERMDVRTFRELALAVPEEATPENQARWAMALAAESRPDCLPEDRMFRARVQALLRQWDATVEAIDGVIAERPESFDAAETRQTKDLLRKKRFILLAAGRSAEAAELRHRLLAVPPRDPDLDPKWIDLGTAEAAPGVYRAFFHLRQPDDDGESYWRERFAESFAAVGDKETGFDIRGRIALNSGRFEGGPFKDKTFREATIKGGIDRPDTVTIPVGQLANRLHFLQWCDYSRESTGTEVAHFLVHYEDGTSPDPIPVIYEKDVANLDVELNSAPPERIAWQHAYKFGGTYRSRIALGRQSWDNPNPRKSISHIDFVSAKKQAVPVLVALTLE